MSIAQLIRDMAAAGAPAEAIALAVEALEAAENKLAVKRAAETERKRRQRARTRDAEKEISGGTVTGPSRDMGGTVTDEPAPSPPPPNAPQTPQTPPPPRPHPEGTPRTRKGSGYPTPDGVTDEQWAGFTRQRKKPLTDRAYTLLCDKLAKLAGSGWPPGDMIDLAIERGWETVFEPREQRNGSHGKPSGWLEH